MEASDICQGLHIIIFSAVMSNVSNSNDGWHSMPLKMNAEVSAVVFSESIKYCRVN